MAPGACRRRAVTEWKPKSSMTARRRRAASAAAAAARATLRLAGLAGLARLSHRLRLGGRRLAPALARLAPIVAAAGAIHALAIALRRRAVVAGVARDARARILHQPEVDAPALQVHPRDLHVDLVGQPVALAGALAAQLVAGLAVLEVLGAEVGDMDHPLDEQVLQRDEDAERRDP